MAFIGRQIDYIPHTGVVFEGVEYFFGGGIQALPPHQVVSVFGMSPVQKIDMGTSTKSLEDLRAFLRSIAHRFTQETYDLFKNNCNNFSNEVSKFLCGKALPDAIIGVRACVVASAPAAYESDRGQQCDQVAGLWGWLPGRGPASYELPIWSSIRLSHCRSDSLSCAAPPTLL